MSAAQRRKQRRLRSWWCHEQQSIAVAWPRILTTQPYGDGRRPGPGRGFELQHTAKFRKHFPLSRNSSACSPKSPAGGGLPAWQSRQVQRHTVEQLADLARMVQILVAFVPQEVEIARGGLRASGHRGARAGYRRAKITHDRIPQRSAPRSPTAGGTVGWNCQCRRWWQWHEGRSWQCMVSDHCAREAGLLVGAGHNQWTPQEGFTASPGQRHWAARPSQRSRSRSWTRWLTSL